jgi:trehalose-6-phosphate synthase
MQSRRRNPEDDDDLATRDGSRRALLDNRRVILASNRGPVDYALVDGTLTPKRGAGGVVTALAALSKFTDVTWVSAAMSRGDRMSARQVELPRPPFLPQSLNHRFVVVDEETFRLHYNQFSNPLPGSFTTTCSTPPMARPSTRTFVRPGCTATFR